MSWPRVYDGYECDHMRPLVKLGEVWHHITPDGAVGQPCGVSTRGAYKVTATYTGAHYIQDFVLLRRPVIGDDGLENTVEQVRERFAGLLGPEGG